MCFFYPLGHASDKTNYRGPYDCLKSIYKQHGIRGWYKGLVPMAWRYVVIYNELEQRLLLQDIRQINLLFIPEMFRHMAFISLHTSGFSNTLRNHMTNCRPHFKQFGSVVRQVGVLSLFTFCSTQLFVYICMSIHQNY